MIIRAAGTGWGQRGPLSPPLPQSLAESIRFRWWSLSNISIGFVIDSFTPGRRAGSSFFQILYKQSQQNRVLLSFVDIQKIWIFTKFGGCSSKIEPAAPILILKFKRAWQTQFFSHTLQILVNDRFFIGNQMIFYSIFCISNRKAEIWEKLLFIFLSSLKVVKNPWLWTIITTWGLLK